MGRNHLYAELTTKCNLSCPYCVIRDMDDKFDHDKFIDQLINFDGVITLFGGEPTFYKDRLMEVFYHKDIRSKITGITTNLIRLDDDIINILYDLKSFATSWSPTRFNDIEYKRWLDNLNSFDKEKVNIHVLSTMTNELLDIKPKELFDIMREWKSVTSIDFEHYVGDYATPEYFERSDNWLCDVYSNWDSDIRMINKERKTWCYMCNREYTLTPDGTLHNKCPHLMQMVIPDKCYDCDYSDQCIPCRVQKYCSRPHKFCELIGKDGNKDGCSC